MTRTRTVLTALVCTSVLALGACSGDDPEPRFAPTPSDSPTTSLTTSTSPSSEVSSIPPEATTLNQSGAENFVDYWFDALSHAMVTGDTSAVEAASSSTCKSCRALIAKIEDLYSRGGRVRTQGWVVEDSASNGDFNVSSPSFLLRVGEAKRALYDGEKLVDRTPMTKVSMNVELASSTGAWTVTALEILE